MTHYEEHLPPVKDGLAFSEPITITLPAYLWWAFHSWYRALESPCWESTIINEAVQEALLQPEFIQEEIDRAKTREAAHGQILGFAGLPPGLFPVPPDTAPYPAPGDEEDERPAGLYL